MKELNIIHFRRCGLQIRPGLVVPLTEVDFWCLWSEAPPLGPKYEDSEGHGLGLLGDVSAGATIERDLRETSERPQGRTRLFPPIQKKLQPPQLTRGLKQIASVCRWLLSVAEQTFGKQAMTVSSGSIVLKNSLEVVCGSILGGLNHN